MVRPVGKTLPDDGLLVGWSLESERRKKVMGFIPSTDEGAASKFLEPILHADEGHLITVAPTGSGKGVGCVIPALLRYRGPVVVIDPKGENYAVTARARREMGQKVVLLDPFKIVKAKAGERGRFNPLDFLSPENATLVEDTEMIASTLVSTAGKAHHDPFWPYMGGQLLVLVLLYQIKKLPPSDWTLAVTRDLLSRSPGSFSQLGQELLEGDDVELRRLAGVAMNPAETTFGGYWAFSHMQTACFKGAEISECISSSSFSLSELVDGDPLSIYIVIPPEKLEAYSNLLKVWISVMMAALTHRRSKPEHPTLFILDETAQLGAMPQLHKAITLLRVYGVRVWSFWQDLSQITGLYPGNWQTLLTNCRVQQFFGQGTRLGSKQTFEVTGLGSPEFLQTLQPGEMVLSVLGDQPVIAQVPNYLKDPPFAGTFDDNPFYKKSAEGGPEVGRSRRIFRRSEIDYDPAGGFERTSMLGKHLLQAQQFHPVSKSKWERVAEDESEQILDELKNRYLGLDEVDSTRVQFSKWPLSFYPEFDYYEIRLTGAVGGQFGYFLRKPGEAVFLDGNSAALHAVNQQIGLQLKKSEIRDYLYYFCSSIEAQEGRFLIVDSADDLTFAEEPDDDYLGEITNGISPPTFPSTRSVEGEEKAYSIEASVLYSDSLYRSSFVVHADGNVEMAEDKELFSHLPIVKDSDLEVSRLRLIPRD